MQHVILDVSFHSGCNTSFWRQAHSGGRLILDACDEHTRVCLEIRSRNGSYARLASPSSSACREPHPHIALSVNKVCTYCALYLCAICVLTMCSICVLSVPIAPGIPWVASCLRRRGVLPGRRGQQRGGAPASTGTGPVYRGHPGLLSWALGSRGARATSSSRRGSHTQ